MKSSQFSLLTPDQKKVAIDEVIRFYATVRDETIGVIAAEEILDMFLEVAGNAIYNKAIGDSLNFVKQKLEGFDFEMETELKK